LKLYSINACTTDDFKKKLQVATDDKEAMQDKEK
jgi:hypothetical protein